MTISKPKAKAKAKILLNIVISEISTLENIGFSYTNILAVPNGKRFLRYAKKANLSVRTSYLFGRLKFVNFI